LFNMAARRGAFRIETSGRNNKQTGQRFIVCEGVVEGKIAHDDFTPIDIPEVFEEFPKFPHQGEPLSVHEFIAIYRKG